MSITDDIAYKRQPKRSPESLFGLPFTITRMTELDRRCADYERRLLLGQLPELTEFLVGLDPSEREYLKRELKLATDELLPPSGPGIRPVIKIGCTLGRYRLIRLIGQGGMGQVFAARDMLLQRDVAVKVLRADLLGPNHIRRFDREARTVAALNHPNILAIYDYGTDQSQPFVVTELLKGKSLADRLLNGPFNSREALLTMKQVVSGMEAAHATGVVHRDLKPGNIAWMREGQIKVLDFGLVGFYDPPDDNTVADANSSPPPTDLTLTLTMTKSGTMIGTVGYVAPEQLRGERVGPPADVFSCGCVLYEMLTGVAAFHRSSMAATIAATLNEKIDQDRLVAMGIGKPLIQLLHGCLHKDSSDRFQSAATLRLAIDSLLENKLPDQPDQPQSAWAETSQDAWRKVAKNFQLRRSRPIAFGLGLVTLIFTSAMIGSAIRQSWTASSTGDSSPAEQAHIQMMELIVAKPSVAILPFEDPGANENEQLTGMTIPMAMVKGGANHEHLNMMPFSSGYRVANAGDNDVITIGRTMKAKFMVTGLIVDHNDRFIVNCEILSVHFGRVVHTFQYDGPADESQVIAAKLTDQLLDYFKTERPVR